MATVETNGFETYYEDRGEGKPVVFVHGLDGTHGGWKPQMDALSDEYRVIAYDIRGSGYTGPTDTSQYSIQLFADDLHELVTALDLNDPAIVGHSMGAMVATTYAARYPDDLSHLVHASTSHPDASGITGFNVFLKYLVLPVSVSLIALRGWEANEAFQERLASLVFGGTEDTEYTELTANGVPDEMEAGEYWKRNIASIEGTPDDLDVGDITVPTLALCGENDAGLIVDTVGEVAEDANAEGKSIVVPNAGHNLPLDNPEAFNREVNEFLTK